MIQVDSKVPGKDMLLVCNYLSKLPSRVGAMPS